ncbi:MAG: molybdopterin-dependent oxidoreductase, partial [Eggerthellaceae bacterium]
IEVVRGMDFVWGCNPFFDSTRQYCDVLLPCCTFWEKPNKAFGGDASSALWFDQIMEPLYESKPESWIAEELAKRLGLDPKTVNTLTDSERTYATVRDAVYTDGTTFQPSPLLTITQRNRYIFPWRGGSPQEGKFTFQEFRDKGILKADLSEDTVIPEPYAILPTPKGLP